MTHSGHRHRKHAALRLLTVAAGRCSGRPQDAAGRMPHIQRPPGSVIVLMTSSRLKLAAF
jgi:hypothetical protein